MTTQIALYPLSSIQYKNILLYMYIHTVLDFIDELTALIYLRISHISVEDAPVLYQNYQ